MKEFKKILFPVDLSESSIKIVPYVRMVMSKFDSQVHLLYVARVFDYFTGIYVPHPSIAQFEKEIIAGAEKRLYEFTGDYFGDCPHMKTAVVAGDASEEIIHYIKANAIDLVVMGTHGRKGLDKVLSAPSPSGCLKHPPYRFWW